ncbi:alpha/beta hydrolase [Roseomonas sp. 18066]|uniref:alpha/beta hydrolase n=1 Tax=Roseomonas sp. 18066 TaxID=2681412 RepID=UPI0013573D66|nr:alpha/beta fold hydrolase [Roseomonas sp. 18066]
MTGYPLGDQRPASARHGIRIPHPRRRHLLAALAGLGATPAAALDLPRVAEWQMAGPSGPMQLRLAWPEAPPPPGGHPLLLVLDGNLWFLTAVEIQRAMLPRFELSGAQPPVICAIGYAGDDRRDWLRRRALDDTPASPDAPPGHGGADAFLDFIEAELLPAIAARAPFDPARRALFGHSYGGLLALHAFLTRPNLFAGTAAISPSLWWNQGALDPAIETFLAAPPANTPRRRLLLAAGEMEAAEAPGLAAKLPPARLARIAENRVVGRARDLAQRLAALPAPPILDFTVFAGEDHGSVIPAALSRAIRFAVPR